MWKLLRADCEYAGRDGMYMLEMQEHGHGRAGNSVHGKEDIHAGARGCIGVQKSGASLIIGMGFSGWRT